MTNPADQSENLNQVRELRQGFWTYIGILVGVGIASHLFYIFLFPINQEIVWGKYVALRLSLWIYYAVFFSAIMLRITEEGLEGVSLLWKKVVRWEEVEEYYVKEGNSYLGQTGGLLFTSNVLVIVGSHSKIEFSFGTNSSRLYKRELSWVLEVIGQKTGKSPTVD